MGAACLAAQTASAAESRRAAAGDTAQVSTKAAKAPKASPPAAAAAPAAVPVDSAKPASPPAPAVAAPAAVPAPVAIDSTQPLVAPAAVPADSTAKPVAVDSAQAAPSAAAAPAIDYGDSTKVGDGRKKKKRIVRETTVNTIDELKGKYRSPKKALFMSLVVPGLGQAYVGQHWFNYARGAAYLMTDVGLALGWHHYVVTKQDRQIARYRAFADSNWRQSRFEDSVSKYSEKGKFNARFPHRETYCQSVQSNEGTKGARLQRGCVSPADNVTEYDEFKNEYQDAGWSVDSVTVHRKNMPNAHNFYELIGKEVEFIWGWQDAEGIVANDSAFTMVVDGKTVPATTQLQQEYIGMRAKANDYARMQAWFLGGMVLNHIVSALDAAFTAHVHNKSLYQTEVGFLDRLHLDSYMAWDAGAPVPTVTATLTF